MGHQTRRRRRQRLTNPSVDQAAPSLAAMAERLPSAGLDPTPEQRRVEARMLAAHRALEAAESELAAARAEFEEFWPSPKGEHPTPCTHLWWELTRPRSFVGELTGQLPDSCFERAPRLALLDGAVRRGEVSLALAAACAPKGIRWVLRVR